MTSTCRIYWKQLKKLRTVCLGANIIQTSYFLQWCVDKVNKEIHLQGVHDLLPVFIKAVIMKTQEDREHLVHSNELVLFHQYLL